MPELSNLKLAFENAGATTLASGIATFGQVFLPGELPSGTGVSAEFGGASHAVQLDVKTRYDDGSVKMAVLSVERPDLAAGAALDVTLSAAAAKPAAAISLDTALAGHSFNVDLTVQGGEHVSLDVLAALHDALAAGTASFWQQGEFATQARVEVPLEGSQRMVFDVTAFKDGGFAVEAQFNNDGAMGAAGGRVAYDVVVTMDGKQAAHETVNQGQYQNWHESFSSNATDGGQGTGSPEAGWLNIHQDIAHLEATGAVANYDLGLQIDPTLLASYAAATQAAGWGDPLATNGVTQYMPGTGGRSDIGFTTEANTSWLISQDAHAAAYALGQAETASAVPWNFWDAKNGTWVNTDAYPQLWTDARGGTGSPGNPASTGLTQQVGSDTGWNTDPAHQPDLSFVPYVLTGERWMLDNLEAQAAWNILGQTPAARGNADDNVINTNQVRGAAWALREVDAAAWAAPDGSSEKAFFQEASDANYAWLVSQIPKWTAEQGEAHGWIPGDYGTNGALPPWQQDYFASTVIAAAGRGNADALTFLNWEANFLVGRFTHEAQGFDAHDGAAYLIAISDPATDGTPYTTWAEIGAQTAARGWSNGETGWSQSQGDYPQLALATLAGIYHLTGSAEAKAAYDSLIADAAPFSGTSDYERDPTFAIAGPDASASRPPVEQAPGHSTPADPTPADPMPADPTPADPTPVGSTPVSDPAPGHSSGLVPLAVVLGAESWNGDPLAVIRVDGQEVFRGTISSQHAAGGERLELGSFASDTAHTVTAEFLNDAWGGTATADRNLYVESVLVDGVATGQHEALFQNGNASFALPATGTATAPAQDVLRIALSEDSWQGDAHYAVLLDGKQVSDGTTQASHAAGGQQVVELKGDFSAAGHEVTLRFLNDAWGGTATADRNLYLDSVTLNGVDQHHAASLFTNADATFDFGGAPAPAAGAGPDVLRVAVPDQGSAPSALLVDGVQAPSVTQAGTAALHEVQGDAAGAAHSLAVDLLQGGSAGTAASGTIEPVEFSGADHQAHAPLLPHGDAVFAF